MRKPPKLFRMRPLHLDNRSGAPRACWAADPYLKLNSNHKSLP